MIGHQSPSQGADFFKEGKVFEALWPEITASSAAGSNVSLEMLSKVDQPITLKINCFVVIREGITFCSYLPIETYGHGVGRRGVIKKTHGIIFSGRRPPEPKEDERPSIGEPGMEAPIRVKLRRKGDKLDRMSRVNYSRLDNVEHDAKVYEIGQVDPEYQRLLESYCDYIFFSKKRPAPKTSSFGEGSGDDGDNTSYCGEEEGEGGVRSGFL